MTGVFHLLQSIMQQTENPFSESMQNKSDAQLLQLIGSQRQEYQAMAILAAEEELKKRDIDPDAIQPEDLLDKEELMRKRTFAFKWYHKAGMFVLPFFIGVLFHWLTSLAGSPASWQFLGFPFLFLCYYMLYHQLKAKGYGQMATDFKHWTSYTLYSYIGILVLGALILLVAMLFA